MECYLLYDIDTVGRFIIFVESKRENTATVLHVLVRVSGEQFNGATGVSNINTVVYCLLLVSILCTRYHFISQLKLCPGVIPLIRERGPGEQRLYPCVFWTGCNG